MAATTEDGAPNASTFEVGDMLGHLAGMRSKTAAAKGVRFSYINSSAKVVSDPLLLSTIVGNFLSNAMKYAPKGRVILGCRRAGDLLRITVCDSGIGLEESRTAQLFTAFSQSDPQSEGLGLGLWIAGRTAALLGHAIDVKSRKGRGSSFSICVPLSRA